MSYKVNPLVLIGRLWIVGLSSFLSAVAVNGAAAQGNAEVHRLDLQANLTLEHRSMQVVAIDLGIIPTGSELDIRVTVNNSLEISADLSDLQSTCNCTEPQLSATSLPPQGSVVLSWKMTVPEKQNIAELSGIFTAYPEQGGQPTFFRYKATVAGLANFGSDYSVLEWNPEDRGRHYRLPLIITAPANMEELAVNASSELQGWKFALQQQVDKKFVEATFEGDASEARSTSGSLQLVGIDGTVRDTLRLGIRKQEIAVLFPATIRFSQHEERWVGEAMLRVRGETSSDKTSTPRIKCTFGDTPIGSVLKPLGAGIYRVNLSMAAADWQQITEKAHAETNPDKRTPQLKCEVQLPNRKSTVLRNELEVR